MLSEQQITMAYKGLILLLIPIYFAKRKFNKTSGKNIGRLHSREGEANPQNHSSPRSSKTIGEILKAIGCIVIAGTILIGLIIIFMRIVG